jgi:hypothetical protein
VYLSLIQESRRKRQKTIDESLDRLGFEEISAITASTANSGWRLGEV